MSDDPRDNDLGATATEQDTTTPAGSAVTAPGKGGKAMATTERVRPMGGMFGPGLVGQKAMNFGPSLKRILSLLAPHRAKVSLVIAFGVVSVALSSVGPRVLGRATDLIFGGVIGRQFPAGLTQDQVVDSVRAAGNAQVADMLAHMDLVPGQGVDFTAVAQVLLLVAAIDLGAARLGLLQGYLLNDVVQEPIFRLRSAAEATLTRLPWQYFDRPPRRELLRR